ncbi:hypothetical protein EDE15_5151 [Edaphobacter aggregans]|uniref:Spermatogenesis-associated protein 20-like TRX domain-containing protein n=1 Tax=Edaphobacter aggregans TaxID=570835 RepID=A0A428MRF8_9BACT|nr:thioredoxin domain-containing protein [Edaphobacter aggregans]RSL19482.1 hypothetical protein EDE15_5151 [Edaphobacter aggregans]
MATERVVSEEQGSEHLNALAKAASAYLRSAKHQPVEWQQWGEEAFAQAEAEDKPILLDIGAVWCHWCHVMDRESYEDAETAKVINDHFVAVKVDRDERPDVDTRYQAAVSAISGQGGWPLTAFLTPDGKPFFGGTYFPPEDRHGRPSFRRVLLTMAEAFQDRRSEVDESAGSVMRAIEHNESFMGRSGNPGPELVAKLVSSALKQFDARSGGFGSQPKFPHSGAIDLLLDSASRVSSGAGAESAKTAAMVTLQKMSRGGIYDHLAGGFHRYSVDDRWVVPHFEKMSYDNSELLKNYVHAFQTFVDPECARVAREMIQWIDEWLSDRERGGFYASQDADYSLDDDGDYFTWTRDEAAEVLTGEELAVASAYYDIGEIGDMHHNPAKNVLHVRGTLEGVAKSNGISLDEAKGLLASAKAKLYAARLKRPTPYVDKTIYVAWNGMMISAYLEAGRVLDMPEVRAFALKSLDRVLEGAWHASTGMAHVVAYGETGVAGARVAGVLDDYVALGHAALDAWEATGEMRYYTVAEEIAQSAVARFYDPVGLGFFDTDAPADGEQRLGALTARRKPLQDSPTPAGNSVAAALLLRLEALNGREDYAVKALETLETFAGVVEHFGLYAASYGLALQRMVQRSVQVCVIGDDAAARRLETVALARYAVNKSVIRLRRDQMGALPPMLAETLPHLPGLQEGSVAVVCSSKGCLPPVRTADELIEAMNQSL